jgi:hypothetical protein
MTKLIVSFPIPKYSHLLLTQREWIPTPPLRGKRPLSRAHPPHWLSLPPSLLSELYRYLSSRPLSIHTSRTINTSPIDPCGSNHRTETRTSCTSSILEGGAVSLNTPVLVKTKLLQPTPHQQSPPLWKDLTTRPHGMTLFRTGGRGYHNQLDRSSFTMLSKTSPFRFPLHYPNLRPLSKPKWTKDLTDPTVLLQSRHLLSSIFPRNLLNPSHLRQVPPVSNLKI